MCLFRVIISYHHHVFLCLWYVLIKARIDHISGSPLPRWRSLRREGLKTVFAKRKIKREP